MKLDPYQKQAAEQKYDYSIIIAGAGTGKTYTLLGRIEYLIKNGLKPEEIVVISYTNETVLDFQKKCESQLGISIKVLTFHKLAIYLLQLANVDYQLCDSELLSFVTREFIESFCSHNNILKKLVYQTIPFSYFFHPTLYSKWKVELIQKLHVFISLCKSKGYNEKFITSLALKSKGKKKAFFKLAYLIFSLYESEKQSQFYFDFDDLITQATQYIAKISKFDFPFKHILIDEFQDSSLSRILMFENLVNYFQMQFTVVGDDCQSIYRFSGTETNCFSFLKSYFPNIHYSFLKYTYRNSQELIDIANHFVQKNPKQIKKEVYSLHHEKCPIEIFFYKTESSIYKMIRVILNENPKQNILFLGRNSFDWKYYFLSQDIIWIDKNHFRLNLFPNQIFTYLTVHQSKGLESDVVILLHLENSLYGFPNQIKYDFFHKYLFSKDQIHFEEERRLFYVALTRTKSKIYLFSPLSHPSVFVNELIHDQKQKLVIRHFWN